MKRAPIGAVVLLAAGLGAAWAQSDTGQPAETPQQSVTFPGSVFSPSNPPVAALDENAMGAGSESRSVLRLAAHFGETLESTLDGTQSSGDIHSVTRGLGSVELQKIWKRYETDLDYVGGGAVYTNRGRTDAQIHVFNVGEKIHWRRSQLVVHDSFSYLPEGSFGHGSFGGAAGEGLGGGGALHFGSLGIAPRITDESAAEFTQTLTPRSAFTVGASYGMVHFTGGTQNDNGAPSGDTSPLLDSHQVAAQAGYSHQLNHEDQIGVQYAFEDLHFPRTGASNFTVHLIHGLYTHRISDRLNITVAAGPQFTLIDNPLFKGLNLNRTTISGRASLHYIFRLTEVTLSYHHYITTGSGFVAGADTDGVRLTAARPLSRLWEVVGDLGYSHNTRVQPVAFLTPRTFQSGYLGMALRRHITQDISGFFRYQFTTLTFDDSTCTLTGASCGGISHRNTATLGLDWNFRPIRLD